MSSHYRVLVSRSDIRPQAELYTFSVQDSVVSFPPPLPQPDESPVVDLKALLCNIYDRSSYDLKLDYKQDPVPPFNHQDAEWVEQLLMQKGFR